MLHDRVLRSLRQQLLMTSAQEQNTKAPQSAPEHTHFWWHTCGVRQKSEILHWLHRRSFHLKSHVIRTLPLCDWSVEQSANKPQTQKEKNVVRL